MTTTSPLDWHAAFSGRAQLMKASTIRELLKLTQQPDIISFAGGLPAPELFPLDAVKQASATVIEKYGAASVQYGTTEGHLPLREWIAAQTPGITPAHVQITTGSQQGLDLLGKVLITPGDVMAVEEPTYMGALQAFQPYEPRYVGLPMDEEGIIVDALRDILQTERVKVLYTIPNFQNPTGRTMSLARRQALVELTAQHGVIVLEDDPYGKLRFSGELLPSLYELGLQYHGGDADANHVVYSSSFSKTLVPGLRDAWVQGARPIINKLVQAKQGADLHTPIFNQMIVTELLADVLPRQIEIVKAAYGARAQDMMARMREHFPAGAEYTTPDGGMFLWVTLPDGVNTTDLLPLAVERKVAYVPGTPFYANGGGENTLRLSYSNARTEQIERGIAALGATIRDALQ
ncbi:PLP-dependent aminotransferase family protein [Deinococcus maricopensis]|uniref:Putative transcriptional regulator, GntR family n=1 Tax=Deinococcus maricopensis (strain DSM 21211 / LMG 22137 / NRRL B-23946 / LB-34) TaxID=709986 RepID=E8U2X2_DEIML|nr:PLP-dependent aminotransferase family protein [Deinococcus maricopensis]ADV65710.1 putative transcriptional regulator, GntR family [Deinococcus maricopensis DSM 21211]